MSYVKKLMAFERRKKEMIKLRRAGKTMREIAEKFGISRQRVEVIIKRKEAT